MEQYEVEILKKTKLMNDIYLFELSVPQGVSWEPGAHMHVGLKGFAEAEGKELVRHMSIMTRPQDNTIGFVTRLPENGSVFKQELASYQMGDTVTLFKIGAKIHISSQQEPMVFLSMGVGIAAVYPIFVTCEEMSSSGNKKIITSIHVSKNEEHLFDEELNNSKDGSINYLWKDCRRDFFNSVKKQLMQDTKETKYFLIGNDVFIKELIHFLLEEGIDPTRICLDKKEEKRVLYFPE